MSDEKVAEAVAFPMAEVDALANAVLGSEAPFPNGDYESAVAAGAVTILWEKARADENELQLLEARRVLGHIHGILKTGGGCG